LNWRIEVDNFVLKSSGKARSRIELKLPIDPYTATHCERNELFRHEKRSYHEKQNDAKYSLRAQQFTASTACRFSPRFVLASIIRRLNYVFLYPQTLALLLSFSTYF